MPTLTRYIARHYLVNCVLLFAVLFAFVVSVDVFVNLGRFVSRASDQLEAELNGEPDSLAVAWRTVVNIVDLWGPRLLQLSNFVAGPVLVGAMGFTCAQLVRHREFVALLASGVPLQRAAWPFVMVGLAITGAQAVNQEVVVPAVADLLVRDTDEAGIRRAGSFPVRLAPDGEGRFFSAARYDEGGDPEAGGAGASASGSGAGGAGAEAVMREVVVHVRSGDGVVRGVVTSERAEHAPGRGWLLSGAEVVAIGGGVEGETGGGVGWREGLVRVADGRLLIETPLDPERLKVRYLAGLAQNLSWRQLGDIIESEGMEAEEAQRLNRLRWGRVGAMVSNLLTVVAALPFFLLRTPAPMLRPALKAMPVALGGLVAASAAGTVGVPGLPVAVSAFVPALVIAPLAVALFGTIRT